MYNVILLQYYSIHVYAINCLIAWPWAEAESTDRATGTRAEQRGRDSSKARQVGSLITREGRTGKVDSVRSVSRVSNFSSPDWSLQIETRHFDRSEDQEERKEASLIGRGEPANWKWLAKPSWTRPPTSAPSWRNATWLPLTTKTWWTFTSFGSKAWPWASWQPLASWPTLSPSTYWKSECL